MTFEFIAAYRQAREDDISHLLFELLDKVLQDNLNDLDFETVEQMIRIEHQRPGGEATSEDGQVYRRMLVSFTLNLPADIAQPETVVEEFTALLPETAPIYHAVKFSDPLLRAELLKRAEEIFNLEMKLRRVITLIYLHANQEGDPYDLLCDESVQPMAKEKPKPEQMKAASENQFFHLTFGQYVSLNQRPEFKQVAALLEIIRDAATYEHFRTELNRPPIQHEDDAVLLAGLKERMDAIETMRNCVAHNRHPSRRVTENYENARPLLNQMLDSYLLRWERARDVIPVAVDDSEQ